MPFAGANRAPRCPTPVARAQELCREDGFEAPEVYTVVVISNHIHLVVRAQPPELQSACTLHAASIAQVLPSATHVVPPQSVPLSVPFLSPSLQLTHLLEVVSQMPLVQSVAALQPSVRSHLLPSETQPPPQSTWVSPVSLTPLLQGGSPHLRLVQMFDVQSSLNKQPWLRTQRKNGKAIKFARTLLAHVTSARADARSHWELLPC